MIEDYGVDRIGEEGFAAVAAANECARVQSASGAREDLGDEALMLAYRAGDAAAFEALYTRHRAKLYRFLLRQCGTAALAEELFQDVWVNVIRARRRYVPQARFTTYLYRIAHNRLIDHFRRRARRPLVDWPSDDEAIAELPGDARLQPEIGAERRAAVQRLFDLLGRLPEAQREAFVMHEEGGLSIEEIALATGVNAQTAKSRLRYALDKLRRGLREVI